MNKLEKVVYTAHATATGGRDGRAISSDEQLNVKLSAPKELGGTGAPGTNPEQLFAAGYSACFGSAVMHVARQKQIKPGPVAITAHVSLGPVGAGFGLKVALSAAIPELAREEAEALVKAAHEVCPYSNATRGNIEVELSVA